MVARKRKYKHTDVELDSNTYNTEGEDISGDFLAVAKVGKWIEDVVATDKRRSKHDRKRLAGQHTKK